MATPFTLTPAPKPARKRRWRKIALIAGVLLLLLVVLLPTILSTTPGKNFILAQANSYIPGHLEADSIALGWFSTTEIHGLKLYDPEGKLVATVSDLTTPVTLIRAIGSNFTGDIHITIPQADINLDTNNIVRALVKPSPAPGNPGATSAKASKPYITKNNIIITLGNANVTLQKDTLSIDPGSEIKAALDTAGGINTVSINLKVHDATHPAATIQLDASAEAFDAGKLRTDYNAMKLHGTVALQGLPLAFAQPFLDAAKLPLKVSGTLDTTDQAQKPLAFDLANRSLSGTLRVTDVTATGLLLKGDTLEKQTIELPLNITWANGVYTMDAHLTSNLMNLNATGTLSPEAPNVLLHGGKTPASSLTLTGTIDAPALARQFPNSLQLNPATKITSGTATLNGTLAVDAAGVPTAKLNIIIDHVAGTQDGAPITLQSLELAAAATRQNNRLVPTATVKMPAGGPTPPGAGAAPSTGGQTLSLALSQAPDNVNQFNATGSYNLAELNQQIAQIINLNGRSFAGTGKLEAFVVFDSNGVIHGGGNIVTENLSAVVLPNTLPIQDAKLEMGFAGNVTTGANVHARISVLRVNGDSIQFVANSPIDLALTPAGTQISAPALHLATQSAQWNPLLVAMKILPKDTAIAGAIDLTAAVDLNSDRAVTASTLILKQLQITSGSTRTPASNVTITLAGTADLKAKTFTLDPAKDDLKISELDPQTGAGNTLTIAKGGKISWGAAPMDVILSTSYSLDRIALFLKAVSPTFAHTLAGNGKTTLHLTGTLDGSISFDGDTQNPLIACDNLLPPNFDFGGPLSGTVTTKPYFTLNAKSLNLVGNRKQLTLAITKGATFATPPAGMQFSADGLNVDVAALDTWNPTLYTLQKLPATSALKGHATITGSIVYDPAAIRSAMTANVAGFQQLSKNAAGQWASTLPSTDIIAALNVSLNLPNSTATFTDTSRIEEHDPTTKAGNSVTIAKGSILTWATGKEENASLVLAYDLARVSALLKPWLPAQLTNMTGQRTLAATTLTGRIIDSPDALKKYSQVQLSNLPIGFDQIVFGGFTLGKGEQPLALTNGVLNLAGAPIPLNSGTLNLGGRVDLNEPTPAYIVDKPVNLLQAIQINQKIAADQLFFLPFSWSGGQGLVGITGKLDLTILDANFPLSADNIKTAGTLHGNLGITGLNANFPLLSSLLSAAGPLLKISQSDYGIHDFNIPNIAITLEKGRITYSNLVLKAGTVTLTFTGSVGLDNTLDMNIALAEPRLPLVIPIHMAGTISTPKLDLKLTAADLLKLNTGGAETGGGKALENLGGFLNPGKAPPSPPPSTTPSAPRGTPRPSITRPTTTAPATRAATSPTTRPTTATFPATQTKPTDLVK